MATCSVPASPAATSPRGTREVLTLLPNAAAASKCHRSASGRSRSLPRSFLAAAAAVSVAHEAAVGAPPDAAAAKRDKQGSTVRSQHESFKRGTEAVAGRLDSEDSLSRVHSTVKYTHRSNEQLWMKAAGGEMNVSFEETVVEVHDVRPWAHELSIDKQGFELHHLDSGVTSWDDNNDIISVYYPEVTALVKKATGAKHVHVLSFARRNADKSTHGATFDPLKPGTGDQPPVGFPHNDYTETSATRRLEMAFGARVAAGPGRFAIMNLWKPMVDVVVDEPLGFLDTSSLKDSDITRCKLVFSDYEGESFMFHSGPHRWFYFSRQRSHEAVLFKQYDSDKTRAQFTPHAAFKDPTCPTKTYIPRRSIEMRLLVLFDLDDEDIKKMQDGH